MRPMQERAGGHQRTAGTAPTPTPDTVSAAERGQVRAQLEHRHIDAVDSERNTPLERELDTRGGVSDARRPLARGDCRGALTRLRSRRFDHVQAGIESAGENAEPATVLGGAAVGDGGRPFDRRHLQRLGNDQRTRQNTGQRDTIVAAPISPDRAQQIVRREFLACVDHIRPRRPRREGLAAH
jgi:hypothetical protein